MPLEVNVNPSGSTGEPTQSITTPPTSTAAPYNDLKISDYKYKGPLASLENAASNARSFSFPSDLGTMGKWMNFTAYEYSKPSRLTRSTYGEAKATIRLPIPHALGVGYNQQYQDIELGAGGQTFLDQGGQQFLRGARGGVADVIAKNDWQRLKQAYNDSSVLSASAKGIGAGILDSIIKRNSTGTESGPAAVIQIGAGVARNPNLAALYTGTSFRQFQFTHKFIARNRQEADQLQSIIRAFKICMSPSNATTGGSGVSAQILDNLLFEYPFIWDIHFDDSTRDYLWEFAPCVLTDFTLDPHAEGSAYYIKDNGKNIPASVNLNFTFKEISVITRQNIEQENF